MGGVFLFFSLPIKLHISANVFSTLFPSYWDKVSPFGEVHPHRESVSALCAVISLLLAAVLPQENNFNWQKTLGFCPVWNILLCCLLKFHIELAYYFSCLYSFCHCLVMLRELRYSVMFRKTRSGFHSTLPQHSTVDDRVTSPMSIFFPSFYQRCSTMTLQKHDWPVSVEPHQLRRNIKTAISDHTVCILQWDCRLSCKYMHSWRPEVSSCCQVIVEAPQLIYSAVKPMQIGFESNTTLPGTNLSSKQEVMTLCCELYLGRRTRPFRCNPWWFSWEFHLQDILRHHVARQSSNPSCSMDITVVPTQGKILIP